MASLIRQTISIGFLLAFASAYLEIDFTSIEQLDDRKYWDKSTVKIRKDKASKSHKVYGNFSIIKEMDNSFKETVVAYVKQGGQYRKMPYRAPEKGLCDFNNDDKYFYPEVAEHSDWPLPFPCPLTPRVIEFRGGQPSLKNVPMSLMATGDYAFEMLIKKDDELVVHFKFFASVINL